MSLTDLTQKGIDIGACAENLRACAESLKFLDAAKNATAIEIELTYEALNGNRPSRWFRFKPSTNIIDILKYLTEERARDTEKDLLKLCEEVYKESEG